jgi:large subunit ribosomal protein L17
MFNNMLESLFRYERIQTTVAKAKELRRISEKLITRAKEDSLHNKRIILRRLHDRDVVAKLFEDIAPKYRSVHGGYTRIIKLGRRQGDGAELSLLELVDVEDRKETPKSKAAKKGTEKPEAQKSKPAKAEEKKPAKAQEKKPPKTEGKKTQEPKKKAEAAEKSGSAAEAAKTEGA